MKDGSFSRDDESTTLPLDDTETNPFSLRTTEVIVLMKSFLVVVQITKSLE